LAAAAVVLLEHLVVTLAALAVVVAVLFNLVGFLQCLLV
jgi:hypothetical protein